MAQQGLTSLTTKTKSFLRAVIHTVRKLSTAGDSELVSKNTLLTNKSDQSASSQTAEALKIQLINSSKQITPHKTSTNSQNGQSKVPPIANVLRTASSRPGFWAKLPRGRRIAHAMPELTKPTGK